MPNERQVYKKVLEETRQSPILRFPFYEALEKSLGGDHCVVSFFTSFRYPVIIDDSDAVMLEETLQGIDLTGKKLAILLSSPGGDPLSAERIVNICRSFSPDGFKVLVPKMAKSAATMICFGAEEVIMGRTSELGPIDPQILIRNEKDEPVRYQAAHEVLSSYRELMKEANLTKGRIEPYLQQLSRFDARDIKSIESATSLTEAIAVNLLKTGMLNGSKDEQIKKKIRPFIDPTKTRDHGRPIFHADAKKCGLNIRCVKHNEPLWHQSWEIFVRLNHLMENSNLCKVIEYNGESYTSTYGPG